MFSCKLRGLGYNIRIIWIDPPSLVLPIVYDVSTNLTQLAEKRDPGPASAITAASHQLKRYAEFSLNMNECSLFPAVRDLLANLVLPSEPQIQPQQVIDYILA